MLETDDALLAGNQVDLELPVWEQEGSDEGPDEQTCRCPLGRDPDPDRRPPDIDKLSTLTDRGRPASQEHRRVHARQGEDEVEERVGVRHRLWHILSLLLVRLAEGEQWLVGTYRKRQRI